MEQNLKRIKAVAMDIDGVMTKGELILLADGDLLRTVDVKDSFAVRFAAKKGLIVSFISGGKSLALEHRCLNLGCRREDLYLGVRGKLAAFRDFCRRNGLKAEEVMYLGDDIPDIQVLEECGIGIVPSDAAQEAKDAADIVSEYPGGGQCVRHAIESVLKAQGKWVFDHDKFNELY